MTQGGPSDQGPVHPTPPSTRLPLPLRYVTISSALPYSTRGPRTARAALTGATQPHHERSLRPAGGPRRTGQQFSYDHAGPAHADTPAHRVAWTSTWDG